MKKTCLLAVIVMAPVQAAPALAEPPSSPPAQAAAQPAKPTPPKLICRIEHDTASRIRTQRICHTADEWNRLASAAGQTVDSMVRNAGHEQSAMMANAGRMP